MFECKLTTIKRQTDAQDTVRTAVSILNMQRNPFSDTNTTTSSDKKNEDVKSHEFDSALLYAQICARNMNLYYQVALETVINLLNSAKTIHDTHLESSPTSILLEFDETLRVHGKRALLKFGPVKSCERAGVKSAEKQMEIDQGLLPKQSKKKGGRALCGVDYVLDWLRATIVSEDPYVSLFFYMCIFLLHHTHARFY
jgi:hypothetical protein